MKYLKPLTAKKVTEASIFGRSGITSGSGMPSSRPTTTLSNPLDVRTGKEGAAQKLIGSNEVDFSKLSDEELDDIIGNIGMTESRDSSLSS
jgi:hypothetical protein